ncbi:CD1247 N-terminal domain-containing protein [Brevibacillus sp. SAFN-007a]|uniref:CD1247 N-terminal domain-containing protein n=1 Tax=Brevibacillus sp. SAFN-007a TaxID=3436862 RepID=UPI003F7E90EF
MLETMANRIAYLRGLADGLDVSEQGAEGKILTEMIEMMDEVYAQFRELHARVEEAEDYVEALDEDLEDVERYLFKDDDALYETIEDDDHGIEYATGYDLDDDEDASFYETRDDAHLADGYEFSCPHCQKEIHLREGRDAEGYRHYVIQQPAGEREYQPINPT